MITLDENFSFDAKPGYSRQKCASIESTFIGGTTPPSWFDPANWDSIIDVETFPGSLMSNPIPHSDRIPCRFDKVTVPLATRIKLSSDVSVSNFQLDGVDVDQRYMNNFIKDGAGKLWINNNLRNKILITNATCTDVTGCACGNGNRESLSRICKFSAGKCSLDRKECPMRIKPEGFCCSICGTVLSMSYQKKFQYFLLENLIRIFLSSHSVKFYMSKTYSNRIQIVILDEDGASGLNAGAKLKETLQLDNHYRLEEIFLQSSWDVDENGAKNYFPIILASVVLISLIFGATLIFYYRNRVMESALVDQLRLTLRGRLKRDSITADFVRFQGEDDKIELRSGSSNGSAKWTPNSGSASPSLSDAENFPKETLLNELAPIPNQEISKTEIPKEENEIEDFLI